MALSHAPQRRRAPAHHVAQCLLVRAAGLARWKEMCQDGLGDWLWRTRKIRKPRGNRKHDARGGRHYQKYRPAGQGRLESGKTGGLGSMTPPGWRPMRAAARRSLVPVNACNRRGMSLATSARDPERVQYRPAAAKTTKSAIIPTGKVSQTYNTPTRAPS